MQCALGFANIAVGLLEHGKKELVLAAEVVVDQPLVDAGALGDAVDARAAEPALGELVHRRGENLLLGAVGVTRARVSDSSGGVGHGQIIHQMVN